MRVILLGVFFGWPGIFGSLTLSIIGVLWDQPKWLFAGAALSLGFAYYLAGSPHPIIGPLGVALPLLHVGGAIAVRYGRRWIAWLLLAPHAGIALYLSLAVLSQ